MSHLFCGRTSPSASTCFLLDFRIIFDRYQLGFHLEDIKQLLDEVEHDIMSYQNRGLCYLPKPKAEADNTDTRF